MVHIANILHACIYYAFFFGDIVIRRKDDFSELRFEWIVTTSVLFRNKIINITWQLSYFQQINISSLYYFQPFWNFLSFLWYLVLTFNLLSFYKFLDDQQKNLMTKEKLETLFMLKGFPCFFWKSFIPF